MTLKKLTIGLGLLISSLGADAWGQTQGANLAETDRGNKGPAAASPAVVSPEYRVGESDVLHINVWKEPELTQTVTVRTDGNISLPLIHEVKVSGMTPLQIQDAVTEKLKAFITNPQVTVTVTDIRSKRAFITGEVARPGGYSLNTETTVLQLIAQAGGFTPFAKRDNIVILRFASGQQERIPFKYKAVVQGKSSGQNIALQPGDTVVVP
jgi:polysaccharide export outer membrane protein